MKPGRPAAGALANRDLALFAAPCLGLAGIGLPLTVYLPSFYSSQLGLDLSAVGVAFMIVRLLDIGVDPVLGVLMDRTRTRFGRFKPWLAAGVPLLMAASGFLFFARPGVGSGYLVFGLALAYGGWSICVLAQTAWGALLSPDYNERSRIYGWWQLFNLIGLLSILVLPIAANRFDPGPATGVRSMGLYLIVVLPISTALALAFVREPPPPKGAPGANLGDWFRLFRSSAVRRLLAADLLIGLAFGMDGALFLFFFTKAKGFAPSFANVGLLLYFLGGLIGGPLWTALARRTNKPTALAAASLSSIAGLVVLYVIPNGDIAWGAVASLVSGLPYAAANQISRAMMADAGDEERLQSGADHTGLLYAILTGTAKIGAALSVGVTFIGLDKVGFDAASDHNSPHAILGLHLLFLGAPAVLFTLAALLLIRYPLTRRRHEEVREALDRQSVELEARAVAAAIEASHAL
jgi:Na+/melibiose symporter-like transporter